MTLRAFTHLGSSDPRNYRRIDIPKHDGSVRELWIPLPHLRDVQRLILDTILQYLPIHQRAIAYRKKYSTVHLALVHSGTYDLVSLDLKNFFPTIDYRRIQRCLLGCGIDDSSLLAGICTVWDTRNRRILPQGAPTSPALANICAYMLDRRIEALCSNHNINYSRYADDILLSCYLEGVIDKYLPYIYSIISDEGFTVNHSKTLHHIRNADEAVTGIQL